MQYKKIDITNNCELLLFPLQGVKTFALSLFVKNAGSAFDSKDEYGIHEVYTRLSQRGTEKYGSSGELNFEMESIGGSLWAGVHDEFLYFSVRSPSEHFEKGLEMLSQVTDHATHAEDDLEKVKTSILSDIKSSESDPSSLTAKRFRKQMYGNSGLGNYTLGNADTVEKLNIESIKKLYGHIKNKPKVFVAVGNFDDSIEELINKYFDFGQNIEDEQVFVDGIGENEIEIIDHELDQAIFYVGTSGIGLTSPDYFSSIVANTIFGAGFGSMVFSEIREKRSLAYYSGGRTMYSSKSGIFYAYGGVNKDKLYDAIEVSIEQIERLRNGDFGDEDLLRAKNYLLNNLIVFNEELDNQIYLYGSQYVQGGRILDMDELKQNVEKITKEDILEYASTGIGTKYSVCLNGIKDPDTKLIKKLLNK